MKDLFKLTIVILVAIIIAVATHFVLYVVDKSESLKLFQGENQNSSYSSFDPTKPISLLSWNIDNGAYYNPEKEYDYKLVTSKVVFNNLSRISKTINDANPDITLLQNIDEYAEKSNRVNEVKYLSSRLDGNSLAFSYEKINNIYTFEIPFTSRYSGLLLLSKSKSSEPVSYPITPSEKLTDKVFNHQPIIQLVRYPITGTTVMLSVFNINLSRDKVLNDKQLSDILNIVQKEYRDNDNLVVVGGTFNAVLDTKNIPENASWKPNRLERKFAELFAQGWSYICDESNPNTLVYDDMLEEELSYSLDGFLLSPDIKVNGGRMIETRNRPSSHNPISVNININRVARRK